MVKHEKRNNTDRTCLARRAERNGLGVAGELEECHRKLVGHHVEDETGGC